MGLLLIQQVLALWVQRTAYHWPSGLMPITVIVFAPVGHTQLCVLVAWPGENAGGAQDEQPVRSLWAGIAESSGGGGFTTITAGGSPWVLAKPPGASSTAAQ